MFDAMLLHEAVLSVPIKLTVSSVEVWGSCVVGVACQNVYTCRGLVAMLVVWQGDGILGTIAVVGFAVGGQGERHGLGTKTNWSLFTSDDAARSN